MQPPDTGLARAERQECVNPNARTRYGFLPEVRRHLRDLAISGGAPGMRVLIGGASR
jgi:hypothetical protein